MTALIEVHVPDEPAAWARCGFVVDDGSVRIGPLRIRCARPTLALAFDGPIGGPAEALGGLVTDVAPVPSGGPAPLHPNGVDGFDHVVLMAPGLDAVRATLDAAGLEIRRERPTRIGDTEVTQVFAFAGDVLLEIVAPAERPEPTAAPMPGVSWSVWGLAVTAPDLEATVRWITAIDAGGCSAARPAVQAGRRIATVRRAVFGMAVELAVMSPRVSPGASDRNHPELPQIP